MNKRIVRPGELEHQLEARLAALGPPKPRRRKNFRRTGGKLALLLAPVAILTLAIGNVLAVHNYFELEGDAFAGAAPGDDWSLLDDGGGDPLNDDSAIASAFVADLQGALETDFIGGGSKDINDLNEWAWTLSPVPNKDDIVHAMAAAYNTPEGLILYFGADRLTTEGDAQIGFWFFKNSVSLNPDGSFNGLHTVGDVLVLSDFTNGGSVANVKVFQWVAAGGDGGDPNLDLVFTGVDCAITAAPDQACATVNPGPIPSPWPYQSPGEPANTIPTGGFFEGGVNLGALGLNLGCGSTFLAETRASQSVDARLHDFALGAFSLCSMNVEKTGDTLSKIGDPTNYSFVVTNTSGIPLFRESIIDNVIGNITTSAPAGVTNYVSNCGPSLAAGASCTITLTYTIPAGSPDPLVNTVTVTYDDLVTLNGSNVTDTDNHSVNLFQPSVAIVKTGDTLSKVGDAVNYTITVNNTSSADTPALVCTVTDTLLGAIGTPTIASGANAVFNRTRTTLAGDPDPTVNTASVTCSPTGFPNVLTANDGHSVQLFQPSVTINKTGDTVSKVGDAVNYTITVNNTSSTDTPNLVCNVTDTLLGSIATNVSIPSGGNQVFNRTRTTVAGDPDPLVNTASVTCSPTGFPNVINASDGHSVNLFQPSVTINKTGDTLSKVGDPVDYTITVTNTSSADSPNLACTVTDTLLGAIGTPNLASGQNAVFNRTRTTAAGDPDPLVNTASVTCSPVGFPNVLNASDGHTVNLFQPSVTIVKTGDATSKIGDPVDYTITVTNTSSADSPNLVCNVTDTLLGAIATNVNLASGQNAVFNRTRTAAGGDPDPLVNTATVTCSPVGFPNILNASDGHSVNLFGPTVTIVKTGDTLSKVGDPVDYQIVVTNTSSADSPNLVCNVSDTLLGSIATNVNLASGASQTYNRTRTTLAADPDPLVNTASVTCSPVGFPNVINASDGHTVNLFQPSVTIVKTGDTLSKISDPVNYTITVNNTSSADSPNLVCNVTDTLLGSIATNVNIASGQNAVFNRTRTTAAGDPDPLVNTASVTCSPVGFPNVLNASDGHSVNLFQPSVTINKTGDTLSKVGDAVNYTITVTNTSSADSPNLVCNVTDTLLGSIATNASIAAGGNAIFQRTRTTLAADPDPTVNTASVTCSPVGFPNVLTANDGHSVNLFQPSVTIVKTGDPFTKATDVMNYTITVTNTSSADTPQLACNVNDSLLGAIGTANLNPGQNVIFTRTRTTLAADPDPLVNTATATCSPAGFPNVLTANEGHSSDVLHPAFTVTKVCKANTQPIPQQGPAVFTITFINTGDAILNVVPSEGANFSANPGQTVAYDFSVPGPFSGQATVSNTVTGTVTLAAQYGLPNTYTFSATGVCNVGGRVNLLKLTQGVADPAQVWNFNLYTGPDGYDVGVQIASDSTPPPLMDFGNINLNPALTYTICEVNVPAGWTSQWMVDTNGDGTADTIVNPYNPDADNPVPEDVGTRCFDFGAGTGYAVPAGGTLVFQVDNSFPGGDARTPGYWKNWNSCSGGGQYANAERHGFGANGYWVLDELLTNPGFLIGDMVLDGVWNNDPYLFQNAPFNNDCVEAVRILDKSDALTGKKKASDAAYNLATALFAAKLNFAAGAGTCAAAQAAALSAQALLDQINFTGTGDYLGPKVKGNLLTLRNQANTLQGILDDYNNNVLC